MVLAPLLKLPRFSLPFDALLLYKAATPVLSRPNVPSTVGGVRPGTGTRMHRQAGRAMNQRGSTLFQAGHRQQPSPGWGQPAISSPAQPAPSLSGNSSGLDWCLFFAGCRAVLTSTCSKCWFFFPIKVIPRVFVQIRAQGAKASRPSDLIERERNLD